MMHGKKRKPTDGQGEASSNVTDEIAERVGDHHSEIPVDYSLLESLNIELRFAPDAWSPPVDRTKIARYLTHEASEKETEDVCRLVGTFRCWYDACVEIIRGRAALKKTEPADR